MLDRDPLQDFFVRVRSVASASLQANQAISRALAPRFRPIELFRPKEVDLSRVISFLLDPREKHGQGLTFLQLFLDLVGLKSSNSDSENVRVWTEDVLDFDSGRADIRLDYQAIDRQNWHLLIENKPWAGDGSRQIDRYTSHMEKAYRKATLEGDDVEGNWKVIYIPSSEHDPSSYSIDPDKLKKLQNDNSLLLFPYSSPGTERTVEGWLERCAKACEADSPRRFIYDFLSYIRENVSNPGIEIMSNSEQMTSKMVVEFLQNRDDDISIALEVCKAVDSLRDIFAEEIGMRIVGILRQMLNGEWEITPSFSKDTYAGLDFRKGTWPSRVISNGEHKHCSVGFEFGSSNWKNPTVGIIAHEEIISNGLRVSLSDAIRKVFPDFSGPNQWWLIRKKNFDGIPSDWMSDEFLRFARQVKNGNAEAIEILNRFVNKLTKIASLLDSTLDTKTH
jgi:hypothetical protein